MRSVFPLVGGLWLTACATSPEPPPTLEDELAAGGVLIGGPTDELIGEDGVTFQATDERWTAYLSPDGRKAVRPMDGLVRELTWRIDGEGRYCEQLFSRDGEEACGRDIARVRLPDGAYASFEDGVSDGIGRFTIRRGNPEGL